MSEQDQVSVKTDEAKQLVDLLQYQDDSIVSRVLLKNNGGTVTLFAFDEGEGLSEIQRRSTRSLLFLMEKRMSRSQARVSRCGKERPSPFPQIGLMQ